MQRIEVDLSDEDGERMRSSMRFGGYRSASDFAVDAIRCYTVGVCTREMTKGTTDQKINAVRHWTSNHESELRR